MKNPCENCPDIRSRKCRDCLDRIIYQAYKDAEENWMRKQNFLSSLETSRLQGKIPGGKENALPVDKTGKGERKRKPSTV